MEQPPECETPEMQLRHNAYTKRHYQEKTTEDQGRS